MWRLKATSPSVHEVATRSSAFAAAGDCDLVSWAMIPGIAESCELLKSCGHDILSVGWAEIVPYVKTLGPLGCVRQGKAAASTSRNKVYYIQNRTCEWRVVELH
jgi:hypothetical protein